MATAILIDGGFALRRFPAVYPDLDPRDAGVVAATLFQMATQHLRTREGERRVLHRIFFYDCPPLAKKAHQPVSGRAIDFAKTPQATFRHLLHDALRRQRKTALRLGHLSEDGTWTLRPDRLRALLRGERTFPALTDDDFLYDVRQKGVDMKIGIDIASLAYKKQVDQIVLVAGDADFVPAAKLARREGIDFILDPMWHGIHASLNEHIDGLRSTCPNPARGRRGQEGVEPGEPID
ncbi:MAG: NYN domain-containing protein [Proteobacteria bacterium]|nr:NYN domain-containing protein [Pseudomonadota bacterium]